MISKNWKPLLPLYFLLLILVSLPLWIFNRLETASLSFAFSSMFVIIWLHIQLLIKVSAKVKWSTFSVVMISFFGIKNFFILLFLAFIYKEGLLGLNETAALIAIYYVIFSITIAKMLLNNLKKETI